MWTFPSLTPSWPVEGQLEEAAAAPRSPVQARPGTRPRERREPGSQQKEKCGHTAILAPPFPSGTGLTTPQKAALNKKMAALRSVPLRVYLRVKQHLYLHTTNVPYTQLHTSHQGGNGRIGRGTFPT